MAARTLLRAIGALGLAMLVATSTLMSVVASIPDRHDHGDAASAIGGQDLVGLAGTVGQAEPPSHCHPEIDCALTAMFLHDDMALPFPGRAVQARCASRPPVTVHFFVFATAASAHHFGARRKINADMK